MTTATATRPKAEKTESAAALQCTIERAHLIKALGHVQSVVDEVRRFFGDVVYDTIIPRTVRLSEAPGFGQPITVYDPRSKVAQTYRHFEARGQQLDPERKRRQRHAGIDVLVALLRSLSHPSQDRAKSCAAP